MQETITLDQVAYALVVREAADQHVAEWRCGACAAVGKALAATPTLALNWAKAEVLVHHAFEHCGQQRLQPPSTARGR
ncbi:MAG: hypothetical protein U0836_24025 [Pirellulales bacterium]